MNTSRLFGNNIFDWESQINEDRKYAEARGPYLSYMLKPDEPICTSRLVHDDERLKQELRELGSFPPQSITHIRSQWTLFQEPGLGLSLDSEMQSHFHALHYSALDTCHPLEISRYAKDLLNRNQRVGPSKLAPAIWEAGIADLSHSRSVALLVRELVQETKGHSGVGAHLKHHVVGYTLRKFFSWWRVSQINASHACRH